MKIAIIAATVLIASVGLAQAGIRADLSGDAVVDFQTTMDMPFMTVGNPGNAPDNTGYGGVDYAYNIGKFEVTAGQYTEFLNAVAATDTYALYNPTMWAGAEGCKIQRSGTPGSYTYYVAPDWEDRPVDYVGWGDAARFCNWLTNGMPTGPQGLTTTEDGAYLLNGATSEEDLIAVIRRPQDGARFYLPTEDEWYKAAYHKNDGVTGEYFNYPTSSDAAPGYIGDGESVADPDPGNYATYDGDGGSWVDAGIGTPYFKTEVGQHENSASPYGTYDQGGNVWEWTDTLAGGDTCRVWRGAAFNNGPYSYLHAALSSTYDDPCGERTYLGFRVVPEPATLSLLALGGLALLRRRQS